ncbi:MAG: hypothetical protein EPN64_00060 [Burkholderiaceae bacterium]|nr:MAG: hypothetical protein EPN64_00060 [Burkholderiaceae bacterium]
MNFNVDMKPLMLSHRPACHRLLSMAVNAAHDRTPCAQVIGSGWSALTVTGTAVSNFQHGGRRLPACQSTLTSIRG